MIRIIEYNMKHSLNSIQMPSGILLSYPVFNLSTSPSPSRALHLNDPILPFGLMVASLQAYVPSAKDGSNKEYLSVLFFENFLKI